MEHKYVKVRVSQSAAIARAQTEWGECEVELAPILQALPPMIRRHVHIDNDGWLLLNPHGDHYGMHAPCAAATTESVVATIVEQITGWVDDALFELQENATSPKAFANRLCKISHIAVWCESLGLPYPQEAIASIVAIRIRPEHVSGRYIRHERDAEPDRLRQLLAILPGPLQEQMGNVLRKRIADVLADNSRQFAIALAEKESRESVIAARQAETTAAEQACEEATARVESSWRAWAIVHGDDSLRRAIENDYPLGDAIEELIVAALPPGVTEEPDSHEDRSIPSAHAYNVQEVLRVAMGDVELPAGMEWEVGRIQRCKSYLPCPAGHGSGEGEAYDEYHDRIESIRECRQCDEDGDILRVQTMVPLELRHGDWEHTAWYLAEKV